MYLALPVTRTLTKTDGFCSSRVSNRSSTLLPACTTFPCLRQVPLQTRSSCAGLQTFLAERTEATILEVGLGGRLDATNVITHPWAVGITPLGYDHMEVLGYTLSAIAGEKAGILKCGCPAFTVPQEPEAMAVLQARITLGLRLTLCIQQWAFLHDGCSCVNELRVTVLSSCMRLMMDADMAAWLAVQARAEEVGAPLTVVPSLERYEGGADLPLGLAGAHQRVNAALAISLAAAWEAQHAQHGQGSDTTRAAARQRSEAVGSLRLPNAYREGLQSCYWPGRAEVGPWQLGFSLSAACMLCAGDFMAVLGRIWLASHGHSM